MSYHFFQRSARTSGGDDDLYDEEGSPILPHEFVKHDRGGKREMDIKVMEISYIFSIGRVGNECICIN